MAVNLVVYGRETTARSGAARQALVKADFPLRSRKPLNTREADRAAAGTAMAVARPRAIEAAETEPEQAHHKQQPGSLARNRPTRADNVAARHDGGGGAGPWWLVDPSGPGRHRRAELVQSLGSRKNTAQTVIG